MGWHGEKSSDGARANALESSGIRSARWVFFVPSLVTVQNLFVKALQKKEANYIL